MTQQPAQPDSPLYTAQNQVQEAIAGMQQPQPNLSFNQQQGPNICKSCGNLILPTFKFCPNCGKPIGDQEMTVGRQIYVYIMSLILPPSGLYWGIKYLFNPNPKVKTIGIVAIVITLVSIIVTVQISFSFFQQFQKEINIYNMPIGGNGNPQLFK